jgi:glutathione synthase/RimK-type ligase-like ATP-grasp enzyme
MLIGIYDLKDYNGRDLEFLRDYERILDHNGIAHVRLNAHQPDFWDRIRTLDLFIMRWINYDSHALIAHDLLPVIEGQFGIPCFPNQATCWHYDDKIRQYLLMRQSGFPMTESYVFYDREAALAWMETTALPTVFKLRNGAGSNNVILVRSRNQGRRLIRRMFGRGITQNRFLDFGNVRFQHFNLYRELHHLVGNLYRWKQGVDVAPQWKIQKNYALFQKYLPGNAFDTRVTVIGERAFAFRRMTRKGDFRASGSGMIDYDLGAIDPRCVEIAHRVSATMGFQSMAYDFLLNENGEPEFCEISYDYLSSAIQRCSGFWDRELRWHDEHCWPEHLHLIYALDRPGLAAPPRG